MVPPGYGDPALEKMCRDRVAAFRCLTIREGIGGAATHRFSGTPPSLAG